MKILNRPMFRKGGSSKGTGVMSMVEPRENYQFGTTIENIRKLGTQYEQALRKSTQPSAGEKAALIAQIASTPGGLYEKITATLPTQAQILAKQRAIEPQILESKMKQEATIAGLEAKASGTSSSKMKEFQARRDFLLNKKEQEVGRSLTQAEKNAIVNQAQEETIAKMPKSTRAAVPLQDKFTELAFGSGVFSQNFDLARTNYRKAVNTLKGSKDRNAYSKNYKIVQQRAKELNAFYSQLKAETKIDPIKDRSLEDTGQIFPTDYDKAQKEGFLVVTKAEGGRVMKAQGNIVTGAIEEQVDTTYGQPQLKSFSYEELRGKLPPEVDDSVVRLLASSENALRDFAYITTQQDINQFNQKYGVNLTLPISG